MADDIPGLREKLSAIKNNPVSALVLLAITASSLGTVGINTLQPPAVSQDLEARADIAELKRAGASESKERTEEDIRIRKELSDLTTTVKGCVDYQNLHRADFRELQVTVSRNSKTLDEYQKNMHYHNWQVESDKRR